MAYFRGSDEYKVLNQCVRPTSAVIVKACWWLCRFCVFLCFHCDFFLATERRDVHISSATCRRITAESVPSRLLGCCWCLCHTSIVCVCHHYVIVTIVSFWQKQLIVVILKLGVEHVYKVMMKIVLLLMCLSHVIQLCGLWLDMRLSLKWPWHSTSLSITVVAVNVWWIGELVIWWLNAGWS